MPNMKFNHVGAAWLSGFVAIGMTGLAVCAAEQPWTEGELTVDQGNVVNLSQNNSTNYYVGTKDGIAVTLHGDMNITAAKYWVCVKNSAGAVQSKTAYFDLGGEAGDTGRLSLDGCAMSSAFNNSNRATVRDYATRQKDAPAVVFENGSSMRIGSYVVSSTASSDGDYLTALKFGTSCYMTVSTIQNKNATDVKILFTGSGACINAWSYGGTLFASEEAMGGDIVLEGQSGAPIDIRSWSQGSSVEKLLTDDSCHDLIFQGACDVRLVSNRDKTPIVINHANIRFRQTGDLVCLGPAAGGCATRVTVDDVLPHGAGVGIVRVVSNEGKTAHVLDLQGKSQKVNGLLLENSSRLISTNAAATVTFGDGDTDGVLGGVADGELLSFVKTGTGTLLVTNATLSTLVVSNGLVTVDGGVLTCGRLDTVGAGRIACVNGGRVVATTGAVKYALPADAADDRRAFELPDVQAGSVGLSYAGAKTLTLLRGGTFGDVEVASGTLRVGGNAVTDAFWRMTFTDAAAGDFSAKWDGESETTTKRVSLAIGRLHPLSAAGEAVNLSKSYSSETTPAAAKVGSSSVFVADFARLGWGLATGGYVGFCTEDLTEQKPIVITFQTTSAVYGYGMAQAGTCTVGKPGAWKIESSADGETGWTLRDERTGQEQVSVAQGDYGNGGVPYRFLSGTPSTFVANGFVKIASGATLNLDDVSDVSVAKLEMDVTSGAGTMTRFVPAESGVVSLVNVPPEMLTASGELAQQMVLPMTFGAISSAENLSAWKVFVNGKETVSRLSVSEGKLVASGKNGMILIVM